MLRELTERIRTGGLKLTGEGGYLADADQPPGNDRPCEGRAYQLDCGQAQGPGKVVHAV